MCQSTLVSQRAATRHWLPRAPLAVSALQKRKISVAVAATAVRLAWMQAEGLGVSAGGPAAAAEGCCLPLAGSKQCGQANPSLHSGPWPYMHAQPVPHSCTKAHMPHKPPCLQRCERSLLPAMQFFLGWLRGGACSYYWSTPTGDNAAARTSLIYGRLCIPDKFSYLHQCAVRN